VRIIKQAAILSAGTSWAARPSLTCYSSSNVRRGMRTGWF
jgi:hypothetical protein